MLHHCFQAIALFNANQHADAMRRVRQLATAYPNSDTALACRIVEASIMHSAWVRPSTDISVLRASGVSTCPTGKQCLGSCLSNCSCRPLHFRCQHWHLLI